MSQGVVVLRGNWQRGSCPMGIVARRVVFLGVVVPGVVVLEFP